MRKCCWNLRLPHSHRHQCCHGCCGSHHQQIIRHLHTHVDVKTIQFPFHRHINSFRCIGANTATELELLPKSHRIVDRCISSSVRRPWIVSVRILNSLTYRLFVAFFHGACNSSVAIAFWMKCLATSQSNCRLRQTKISQYKLRVLASGRKCFTSSAYFPGISFFFACIVIAIKWETAHIASEMQRSDCISRTSHNIESSAACNSLRFYIWISLIIRNGISNGNSNRHSISFRMWQKYAKHPFAAFENHNDAVFFLSEMCHDFCVFSGAYRTKQTVLRTLFVCKWWSKSISMCLHCLKSLAGAMSWISIEATLGHTSTKEMSFYARKKTNFGNSRA